MKAAKKRLSETLKTHFCDLTDTTQHESTLRHHAVEYIKELNLDVLARYHKALGDVNRLSIMRLLSIRDMCVCELTAALGMSQPNLTHHIKKLAAVGLVERERQGKWIYYRLVDKTS